MQKNLEPFLEEIRSALPNVEVLDREEERLIYAHGTYPVEYKWILQGGPYPYVPGAILVPRNTEEVSAILKLANQYGLGVIPYGGGSGIVGGSIAENGEIMVDMKLFTEWSINTVNCTARVGAGVIGADLENWLNEQGYTSGHYPQSFQSAVVGGMAATRAIGTFSTKYGKFDDMVNSIEVVLADGDILRTHPAPKRSTGPELKELFLGSEGVFGIITQVEIYIYPIAEKRYFEAYTFPRTQNGLEAIRNFIQRGIKPAVIRLYDETEAVHKIGQYGFEKGFSLLIVGYEGIAPMVDLERGIVRETCVAHLGLSKGEKAGIDWFNSRFSTKKMLDYDRMRGGTADAIEVAAPWDCIATVWEKMREALEPLCVDVDCHFSHVYHSGASVYVIFHAKIEGDDKAAEAHYQRCLQTAIETSLKYGGNVSHHHGSGKAKARFLPAEYGEGGYGALKKIKAALDPAGTLNKGVLGL